MDFKAESLTYCQRDVTSIFFYVILCDFCEFLLLANRAGETSWKGRAEQVSGALTEDNKNLICQYFYRFFKFLQSLQRTTGAKLCVLLSKENGISRDFGFYVSYYSAHLYSFLNFDYHG